ncbi:BA14K family protein [Ensifer sp.]|uniref:BA14K family protein n=1 Tax=Ensifer sp. TaxID=1872086 RepID=UPI0039C8A33C
MRKIGIALLAAITALSGITPASAMPVVAMERVQKSEVLPVQDWRGRGDRGWHGGGWDGGYRPRYRPGYRPGWNGGYRPGWDGGYRPGYRPGWSGGYRPGYRPGWNGGYRYGYYNGYRGYRYERYGYRRHNDGWWYPLAAFGAGVVIGGAIAAPPRSYDAGVNPRHVDWCYARYRSYRAWDNSFQPYGGPRQQCYSPYF